MRPILVFTLLLGCIAAFIALQLTRTPKDHVVDGTAAKALSLAPHTATAKTTTRTAPANPVKGKAPPASKGAKGGEGKSAPSTAVATQSLPKKKPGKTTTKAGSVSLPAEKPRPAPVPKPRLGRPLRVLGLGWDLVAAGVLANDGARPGKKSLFSKKRLEVNLSALDAPEAIEAALARGGKDKLGADVAILPLPAFVASYDRIRALKPQILFVTGWSNGREGLMLPPTLDLKRPPRSVRLVGLPGDPATLFSLYMLELAGVPAKRITLVSPKARARKSTDPQFFRFSAYRRYIRKMLADKRAKMARTAIAARRPSKWQSAHRFATTSADAPHLIPIVAVAPAGLVRKNRDALTVWSRVWQKGVALLEQDVPSAARRIAAQQGAPPALELIQRLGQMKAANVRDNARLAGLSGRAPINLDTLFRTTWRLWRNAGVLSGPAPELTPISNEVLTAVVRAYPKLAEAPRTEATARATQEVAKLLTHRLAMRRMDEREVVGTVARIASLFPRAQIVLSVRSKKRKAQQLLSDTTEVYDLGDTKRLRATSHSGGTLVQLVIHRAL